MAKHDFQWVHVRRVAERVPCAFCFFIGGRGVGKTYGSLSDHRDAFLDGKAGKLLYTRLTVKEMNACATEQDNPYNKLNTDKNWNIYFESAGKDTDAFNIIDNTGDEPLVIGEGRSLASFHNLRGVDFSAITEWYFDEFIPTENVRKTPEIKRAGFLFSQAYETVNRNRELLGEPPVKVIFTANAFDLNSSILAYFGLIDIIQNMQRKGQKRYTDRERDVYIELVDCADIAEAKKQTALYRALAHNKKLVDVAINNKFDDPAIRLTRRDVKLIEYTPVFNFDGQFTLYQHKSTGAWYFARRDDKQAKERYTADMRGRLLSKWGASVRMVMFEQRAIYDSADTYYTVDTVFDKRIKQL
jgi:hypothetical protein